MKRTVKWAAIAVAAVVLVVGLLAGGALLSRTAWGMAGYGLGMMAGYTGPGMMGNGGATTGILPGMMSQGVMGSGMMGGNGIMSGDGLSPLRGVQPLTLDQAEAAVKTYLAGLNNPDLALDEVLVFRDNAYACIVEKSTGVGAFEVLVQPGTLAIVPEPGPNMMWNTKYGMMAGGMMRNWPGNAAAPNASAKMAISANDALQTAQRYLDTSLPGDKAASTADAFYGYYTIEIARDGQMVGMLSVNGSSNQVWVHTWHGDFIAAREVQ